MARIYLVYHSYDLNGCEETKLIGAYSSQELANTAIERASQLPGFKIFPEAFEVVAQKIDEDHWTEGFVTLTTIELINFKGQPVLVQAEALSNNKYRIFEYYNQEEIHPFKNDEVVLEVEENGKSVIRKI